MLDDLKPRISYFYQNWEDRLPFYVMVLAPVVALATGITFVISSMDTVSGLPDTVWGLTIVMLGIFLWQRVLPVGKAHAKVIREQQSWLMRALQIVGAAWITYYAWNMITGYLQTQILEGIDAPHFVQVLGLYIVLAIPLIAVLVNVHWMPAHARRSLHEGLKIKERRARSERVRHWFTNGIADVLWESGRAIDPETGETIVTRDWGREDYLRLMQLMVDTSDTIEKIGQDARSIIDVTPHKGQTTRLTIPTEDELANYDIRRIAKAKRHL